MEIKVNEITVPESIDFNYEELKKELTDKVSIYESMVYTDETIKEAKADRVSLNRLKKSLNDERINREREYMKPFTEFKNKVNDLISIIEKPVEAIDRQVKEYEAIKRAERTEQIEDIFESKEHPEWLTLKQIFSDKWLNVSTTLKTIETEMDIELVAINNNLKMLSILPEFSFEAIEVYKYTLDAGKAVSEAQKMSEIAKKKVEMEQAQKELEEAFGVETEIEPESPKQWMHLEVLISEADFDSFEQWAKSRNIEWRMS